MNLLFCEKHKKKLEPTSQNGKTVYVCRGCETEEFAINFYRKMKAAELAKAVKIARWTHLWRVFNNGFNT
jgi:DNA-directed RNA polymerase subunit M/transcription elongation factor TFIIS